MLAGTIKRLDTSIRARHDVVPAARRHLISRFVNCSIVGFRAGQDIPWGYLRGRIARFWLRTGRGGRTGFAHWRKRETGVKQSGERAGLNGRDQLRNQTSSTFQVPTLTHSRLPPTRPANETSRSSLERANFPARISDSPANRTRRERRDKRRPPSSHARGSRARADGPRRRLPAGLPRPTHPPTEQPPHVAPPAVEPRPR